MGKEGVKNEITGLQKTALMHASAHLASRANRLLVCDTDALATHLFHRHYTGRTSAATAAIAAERAYTLYILTAPDFPFVQDGTREGEESRHEMHRWLVRARGTPHPSDL